MIKALQRRLETVDITIEDLVVCPIDDHATIGVQYMMPAVAKLPNSNISNIPKLSYDNNTLFFNYLI